MLLLWLQVAKIYCLTEIGEYHHRWRMLLGRRPSRASITKKSLREIVPRNLWPSERANRCRVGDGGVSASYQLCLCLRLPILNTLSFAVAEGIVTWVRTSEFSDCELDFAQVCIPICIICYCAEASRAAFPRQAMKPVQRGPSVVNYVVTGLVMEQGLARLSTIKATLFYVAAC